MIKQKFEHINSLRQLKLLPMGHDCSPGKSQLPLGKGPSFSGGKNVSKLLAIKIISYLFLYRFVTYHWKVHEESYNFIVERTLIKTQNTKVTIVQSFEHILSHPKFLASYFVVSTISCSLQEEKPKSFFLIGELEVNVNFTSWI
jgi:hypothetical protein